MEELKITTYKRKNGKKVVDKVYKSSTFDIDFGIAEDIAETLDKVTNKSSDNEILGMVLKNIKNVSPLMLDIFDGLTEEELRTVSTKEIVDNILKVVTYAINQFNSIVVPKN